MRQIILATTALAALAALSGTAPAAAQEAVRTLPETVVTATGVPTDPARVAAGITVIGRRTIEERGYTTLAEALTAVPGLRIVQTGGTGQTATVFLRGTNSNHVLVLRDGVPQNDPSTPNGLFNFGDDLLDDVERIEIVRGPMAGIYGSSAIGGVINLITRRGAGAFNGAASLSGGTQRTVNGNLHAGGRFGAFDGVLAAGSLSTRGSNIVPPRVATSRGEADGLTAQAVTANIGAWLNEETRLGLIGRWRQNGFGYDNIGSANSTIVDDPNARGETALGSLHATATTLIAGRWRTGLSAARIAEERTFRNLIDGIDPTAQRNDDSYKGWRTDLQWTNAVSLPSLGAFTAGAATFGLQYTRDEAEVRVRSSNINGAFNQDVDARTGTTGGYLGLQGAILDRIDLAGSLRHDAPEDFENSTTWRMGGVWRMPLPLPVRASAAYGTGFRTPTLFDRFGTDGFGFRGNPNLRPEKSEGWEAGLAVDLQAGPLGLVTLSSTYFNTEIRDLIATQFSPVYTQVNVGQADIEGVETSFTMAPSPSTALTLSHTYVVAKDARTGLQLPRRPRNTAAATLRWAATPAVTVTPELLLFGPSIENAFAAYNDAGNAITVRSENPGGVLLNLTARWRVVPGWEVFAIGRNLTNSRYEPANGFVSPSRGVFGGLTARW
jgi:vitamin B12 transporter